MSAINKQRLNILDKPVFVYLISMLTVFSAISFSVETIPDLDKEILTFLHYSEIVIVGFFTIEYFYRIYIAENKLKYIFSFYGLIDLMAILPFYLLLVVDLRSLRLFRLLRLIKILKLLSCLKKVFSSIGKNQGRIGIVHVGKF